MYTKLPQIDSISNMKHNYVDFLRRLDKGPIVLTQHGQPVAVLLSTDEWNKAADEHENLQKEMAKLRKQIEQKAAEQN